MTRSTPKRLFRTRRYFTRHGLYKSYLLGFEPLEDRVMLDGGLPASIVVGRTLSSYFVGQIQNDQETITYTVYNEQADPETGVLLTTTLEPGVTFASSSVPPNQSGPNLAWSLGTIQGYDRASVTLTVTLPASNVPTQLDSGAHAYATLDAGSVSNSTPAATLSTATAPAADLLASTPDANTTDPYIQEEAAKLSYDPTQIFNFLHAQIGCNSYTGSMRGARGTLWSGAGNALDVASLGVALMRASGIPAQYAQGTLSSSQAQPLILSMFPPSLQTVGYVPSGTATADPANDGQLQSETQDHYWFQFDTGSGMKDADPLMSGATIGQTFTTASSTFAEVADNLREKTEIQLSAEIYSQAGALFGGDGLSTSTVLDKTFNDVDLVGRTLTIGNLVTSSSAGFVIAATTNTYTPYIDIGDEALSMPEQPEAITGTPYQEVLTNFPLGSQILTGLFLDISLSGPGGSTQTFSRALVDRIGYAARQGLASPGNLSIDPSGPPIITPFDLTTLDILPAVQSAAAAQSLQNIATQMLSVLSTESSPSAVAQTEGLIAVARAELSGFALASDQESANLASGFSVAAYPEAPRLTVFSSHLVGSGSQSNISYSFDLIKDSVFSVASPGQSVEASRGFAGARGVFDSFLEAQALPPGGQDLSAATIVQKSIEQGIPLVVIGSGNLSLLQRLQLPADAIARITANVRQGLTVIVPAQPLTVNGTQVSAWFNENPSTGELIAESQDGEDQGIAAYAAEEEGNVVVTVVVWNVFRQTTFRFLFSASRVQGVKNVTLGAGQVIEPGLFDAVLIALSRLDPPLPPQMIGLDLPYPTTTGSTSTIAVVPQPDETPGPVAGTVRVASVAASGSLSASWQSASASTFSATSLSAPVATVFGPNGRAIGTGSLVLSTPLETALSISGNALYRLDGQGDLSFYGPAEAQLGVGGDWQDYTASVAGTVALTLDVPAGALTLAGQALPAGAYTIGTTAASFSGAGTTNSPNFAATASLKVTGGTINVGPGTGTLSSGGKPVDLGHETTFDGFGGTMSVAATGDGTESVTLAGNAANLLGIAATPSALTTDQNTPITFQANLETSLADSCSITANSPPGWTVAIDGNGKVTVSAAPGVQGGTFPIQLIARSTSDPNLAAQSVVNVTITPTQPGLALTVAPDPQFTVPLGGAQVPTAFRATIHNDGPNTDTFNLAFANVPSGFTLASSATSITIPAGQTGFVGLYLVPNAPLPAPGTEESFSVTATSTADKTITQTVSESFTMPAVEGVTVASSQSGLSTTPGAAVSDTLTLTNVGNVTETNITLASTAASGLTVGGLPTAPVSLAPGASITETVTLTPDAKTPLNSSLQATITATYGPSGAPQTQTVRIPVQVVAPGVGPVSAAGGAADQAGNTNLGDQLNDLSTALTSLYQNPTDPVAHGQVSAALTSLISQVSNDPFLASFAPALTTALSSIGSATTASSVAAALSNLGQALGSLAHDIADEAASGFTLSLSPDRQVVQPSAPEVFTLALTNNGKSPTTYDLAVSGLPSSVNAAFSATTITLQPGQSIGPGNNGPTLTLTEAGTTLVPADFTVTAKAGGAPEITLSAAGHLTLRGESISVASVSSDPPYTNAGGKVAVSAQVQAVVNEPTTVNASYVVTDPSGKVLFTSTSVSVALAVASTLTTAALGTLDTTGFANGTDTIRATLTDAAGKPIAGASALGTLVIGAPVTGSITTTPAVVPTGKATVTTTVQVNTGTSYPDPLTLQGAATTPAPGTSVALYQSGGKMYAYESGTGGIDVIDVTNPAAPQFVRAFGQNDVTNGQFGFNVAKVVQGQLIVGTSNGNNGSVFNLLDYSLANPSSPTLTSNTTINYHFLSDLLVNSTGTAAFVPTNGFTYGFGGSIFSRFGDFVSIDLSTPASPKVAGALFNNQGQPSGGDNPEFGGTLVNDQVTYVASTTEGGGTIVGGTGNLLVVNVADPKAMSVVSSLQIPGTFILLNVAVQGNRALVAGVAGADSSTFNPNATGVANHLALTLLDISNPDAPKILGQTLVTNEQFPLGEAGAKTDVVSLGNGNFAISDTDANGKPALLVVDPADPTNIIVSAAQVPSGVHGITVSGNEVYATTSSGLSVYKIGPLVSDPLTVTVNLPAGTAANIVPGSYNLPPTQVNTSANGDSLVWDRTFAAGNTNFTFSWQSTVSNVQAGQVIPVTTGASLGFAALGTPGTTSLPGTSVTGAPIVSVSPASQTAPPGGAATYDVRLTNPTGASVTYSESVTNFAGEASVNLPFSVTVPAGGTVDEPLTLSPFSSAPLGTFPFTVSVTDSQGGASGTATSSLTIAGTPVLSPQPNAYGVVVQVTPAQATAGQGTSASYTLRLTNTGSGDDHYTLTLTGLPSTVTGQFGANNQDQFSFDVPPGASNFREIPLTLTAAAGTTPGAYPFTVTASDTASPTPVSGTGSASLTVVKYGVSVSLTPETNSTAPGATFDLVVTNTGTVADTFDLALGGPAALVAALGSVKTTMLAPGGSETIKVTTGAVTFAVPGDLDLFALASSEADPAVQASASTELTIPTTQGLAANLSPSVKILPIPGTTSFLLEVNNTGNAEDAYTATLMGTTGPLTASLTGLDGVATLNIPVFRLPGLSTGAVVINTDLLAFGAGTVTVQIQSLSDRSRTATATAQVSAQQVVAAATTTQLAGPSGPLAFGQAVTLTATVAPSSGSGTPTGLVTFTVDGVARTPVLLSVVNGHAQAVLTLTALSAGTHHVQAFYGGSPAFTSSVSGVVPVVVNAAVTPPTDGPKVTRVSRYGFHMLPTELVLSFDQPLDPARAQNITNYRIVGPMGRVGVASAIYDAAAETVTLHTAGRLNVHWRYVLTVNGQGPLGVTNTSGELLDGTGSGHPGGNYVAAVDLRNLTGRSVPNPARLLLSRWSHRPSATFVHHASSSPDHPTAVHRVSPHPVPRNARTAAAGH